MQITSLGGSVFGTNQQIAYLITQAETNNEISWWENKRKGSKRIVIWYESEDFAVVLEYRKSYYLLKTAYYLDKPHRKATFKKERDNFWKAQKG